MISGTYRCESGYLDMPLKFFLAGISLFVLIFPGFALAEESFQVGDRAYVAQASTLTGSDGSEVRSLDTGTSLEIQEVEKDRVRVTGAGEGWIPLSALVPVGSKGIAAVGQRIESSPNDPLLYQLRARMILFGNGTSRDAAEVIDPDLLRQAAGDLEKALALDPTSIRARLLRGHLRLKQSEWQPAIDDFTYCLETPERKGMLSEQDVVTAMVMRGEAWRGLNAPDQAKKDFVAATRLQPLNFDAQKSLGQFALKEGEYELALGAGNAMVVIRPKSDDGYRLQGFALCGLGKGEDALEPLDRAIALPPEIADEYEMRGILLYEVGEFAESLEDIEKAVEMMPENVRYLNMLGLNLDRLARYDEAVTFYNRAIELAPDEDAIYSNRAGTFMRQGRYHQAITDLEVLSRANAGDVNVLRRLADCYLALGKSDKALEYLDEAVQKNPNNSMAWEFRGSTHLSLGRLPEAKHDFAIAIFKDRANYPALLGLGRVYIELGELDQAKLCLDPFIEANPDSPYGYNLRGMVHFKQQMYDEAWDDFDMCITIDPNFAVAHSNMGHLLVIYDLFADAITEFDLALELDPQSHLAYQGRALAEIGVGEFDAAVIDATRSLEIQPVQTETLTIRAQAYMALDQLGAAKEDLKSCLEIVPTHAAGLVTLSQLYLLERDMTAVEPLTTAVSAMEQCELGTLCNVVLVGLYGKLLNQEAETFAVLEAASKKSADDIFAPYFNYLQGKITREALMQSPIYDSEDYLSPRCYRGLLALIDKKPEEARRDFQWVIEQGTADTVEFVIARAELARLDAANE